MRGKSVDLVASYARQSGKVRVRLEFYRSSRRWQTWTTYRGETRFYECSLLEQGTEPTAQGATRAAQVVITLLRLDWRVLSLAAVWSPRNDMPVVVTPLARAGRARPRAECRVA